MKTVRVIVVLAAACGLAYFFLQGEGAAPPQVPPLQPQAQLPAAPEPSRRPHRRSSFRSSRSCPNRWKKPWLPGRPRPMPMRWLRRRWRRRQAA